MRRVQSYEHPKYLQVNPVPVPVSAVSQVPVSQVPVSQVPVSHVSPQQVPVVEHKKDERYVVPKVKFIPVPWSPVSVGVQGPSYVHPSEQGSYADQPIRKDVDYQQYQQYYKQLWARPVQVGYLDSGYGYGYPGYGSSGYSPYKYPVEYQRDYPYQVQHQGLSAGSYPVGGYPVSGYPVSGYPVGHQQQGYYQPGPVSNVSIINKLNFLIEVLKFTKTKIKSSETYFFRFNFYFSLMITEGP